MTELKVKVGGTATDDGADFVTAWRRIERGDKTADHAVAFQSWEALAAIMTPERLRLLRHVHRNAQPSIAALAKALGRQYRRVHEDVTLLARSGLLERGGGTISASVDRIEAVIDLAEA